MKAKLTPLQSGLPGLDKVLQGLLPGDNVVWEVDGIEDYLPFVQPICRAALAQKRKLVYFRFAGHPPLVDATSGAVVRELEPAGGFEKFLTEILDEIEKAGPGAFYIFDCLSDLAADWFSDQVLGNFFLITCPYLYQLETIAYFALLKNKHSHYATDAINRTAQVVLEVYRKHNRLFIHPVKVFQRYTPTLYMIHSWEGDEFKPVTSSAIITDILSSVPHPWLEFSVHRVGVWTRTFREAQETWDAIRKGTKPATDADVYFQRLLKMAITRDERFLGLAQKYFDLGSLIDVLKRMIGTGLIGGKSLGMLLARAILKKADRRWEDRLEEHDSFFIGADVFYTYLVRNGCWWLRRRPKDFKQYLERSEEARQRLLEGEFPQYFQDQFMEMLEYFGQAPIIVRSSSLLEDNYGNAFSGKYESVFCANQGTPQERLDRFMAAVRTVYASTMSREGLLYRQHHGLLDRDEQMGLLIQRVSGEMYERFFFPQLAGVGFSFNPFVWHEDIDPNSGMLRLVFGLGTRAVERPEDDYTRLVSLSAPLKRPETSLDAMWEFSQRKVDVLDLKGNQLVTRDFPTVAKPLPRSLLELFASCDEEFLGRMKEMNSPESFPWVLDFEHLLSQTEFVQDMRDLLRILQQAYDYPVDIEFTANFLEDGRYRINLVQCRPFQVKIKGEGSRVKPPPKIEPADLVLQSRGPVVGHSLATILDRIIYVEPAIYSQLTMSQRYSVARTIGRLTHLDSGTERPTTMLVGPGRWGTSMPSLGVPVSFAEINTVSVLCEIALMHEGLTPDVSLGTHFFNDLVEMDMLYLSISPGKDGHHLNQGFFQSTPNRLLELLPTAKAWSEVIRVIDAGAVAPDRALYLNVDSMKQSAVCYQEIRPPTP